MKNTVWSVVEPFALFENGTPEGALVTTQAMHRAQMAFFEAVKASGFQTLPSRDSLPDQLPASIREPLTEKWDAFSGDILHVLSDPDADGKVNVLHLGTNQVHSVKWSEVQPCLVELKSE